MRAMPLAFSSRSHGTIAFGFFNIETDLLLLERCFFFADRFCQVVLELSERDTDEDAAVELAGWRIGDPAHVGHLQGAIRGVDHSGFIGAVYRRFPFPPTEEGFKQNPQGSGTQAWIEEVICGYAEPRSFPVRWDVGAGHVQIAEVVFDLEVFADLVRYVELGGYPRWRDGTPPAYVRTMSEQLARCASPFWRDGGHGRGSARGGA
jgi:hypothetical protein